MATATFERPKRSVKRTTRTRAKLLLMIGDEFYEIRWLLDDPDGCGYHHFMRRVGGRWFKIVQNRLTGTWDELVLPKERYHCEGCGSGRCEHVKALFDVGMA
jgi:hypothetical protein